MWTWLLLLNVLVLGFAQPALSADAALSKGGVDQAASTSITSKKMTFKNQDSQAVFEGAVVLTQGALIVYSDHMVVSFCAHDASEGTGRKLEQAGKDVPPKNGFGTVSNRTVCKIDATGRVKIERDAGNATSERAVYYRDEDKIVLTGNPVAWEKGTRVSGKQITMYLAEDRSVWSKGVHTCGLSQMGRQESDGGRSDRYISDWCVDGPSRDGVFTRDGVGEELSRPQGGQGCVGGRAGW
jgi:lipopolysaccharide export system protein LptA